MNCYRSCTQLAGGLRGAAGQPYSDRHLVETNMQERIDKAAGQPYSDRHLVETNMQERIDKAAG